MLFCRSSNSAIFKKKKKKKKKKKFLVLLKQKSCNNIFLDVRPYNYHEVISVDT